jgi:hypothetical protein
MVKTTFEVIFYLAIIAFCFSMAVIPADGQGFTSPYFDYDEMRRAQEIEFEHQELLDYAKPWQVEYLRKIDAEHQKVMEEIGDLKKRVKHDPNNFNGPLFIIEGNLDSEVELALDHEIRLRLESEEWEFKNVLAYWKSLRTHPDSPLKELKNYLSQRQVQKE